MAVRPALHAWYQGANAELRAFLATLTAMTDATVPLPLRREKMIVAGRAVLDATGRLGAGPYGEERTVAEFCSAVALLIDACRSGTAEEINAGIWWVQRAFAEHRQPVRERS